jgi:hypothetical protein
LYRPGKGDLLYCRKVSFRKEMLMKKLMLLVGVLALCLSGCGSDERDQLISSAKDEIDKAGSNLDTIRENVQKWEKEKKETEKANLLKNAVNATAALSKNAQMFQAIKGRADRLEPSTPEQRKELVDKYRDRFASAIDEVNKKRIALNKTIAEAEKLPERAALAELKISLQKAQGDFENLVKQR